MKVAASGACRLMGGGGVFMNDHQGLAACSRDAKLMEIGARPLGNPAHAGLAA